MSRSQDVDISLRCDVLAKQMMNKQGKSPSYDACQVKYEKSLITSSIYSTCIFITGTIYLSNLNIFLFLFFYFVIFTLGHHQLHLLFLLLSQHLNNIDSTILFFLHIRHSKLFRFQLGLVQLN